MKAAPPPVLAHGPTLSTSAVFTNTFVEGTRQMKDGVPSWLLLAYSIWTHVFRSSHTKLDLLFLLVVFLCPP